MTGKKDGLPNVVWIVLDACRMGRMSLYGYGRRTTPVLEKISRDSTVFESAITNAPWTCPSTPCMLTGKYASQHGIFVYSDKIKTGTTTITDVLKERGYVTGSIDAPWVHAMGLHRGFDHNDLENLVSILPKGNTPPESKIDTGLYQKWPFNVCYHFLSRLGLAEDYNLRRRKRVIRKIKDLSGDKPFFLLVWMLDTHLPYIPQRKYQRFNSKKRFFLSAEGGIYKNWNRRIRRQNAGEKQFSDEEIEVLNDLYDSSVYFSDHQIGEMIGTLEDMGILDDTLMVVTADHGENIGDHGNMDHQMSLHETLLRVPLLIRYPHRFPRGKRIPFQVETKDIFHTLKHVTEVDNKGEGPAESYLEMIKKSRGKEYTFGEYKVPEWMMNTIKEVGIMEDVPVYRCFVRSHHFKLIRFGDGTEKLYRIDGDEVEVDPEDYPSQMKSLSAALDNWKESLDSDTKMSIKGAIERLKGKIKL